MRLKDIDFIKDGEIFCICLQLFNFITQSTALTIPENVQERTKKGKKRILQNVPVFLTYSIRTVYGHGVTGAPRATPKTILYMSAYDLNVILDTC